MSVLANRFEKNHGYRLMDSEAVEEGFFDIVGPDSVGAIWVVSYRSGVPSPGLILRSWDLVGNERSYSLFGDRYYCTNLVLDGQGRPWIGNWNDGQLYIVDPVLPDPTLTAGPILTDGSEFFCPCGAVYDRKTDTLYWLGLGSVTEVLRLFTIDYKAGIVSSYGASINPGPAAVYDFFEITVDVSGYIVACNPRKTDEIITFDPGTLAPSAVSLTSSPSCGLASIHYAFGALYLGSDVIGGVGSGSPWVTTTKVGGTVLNYREFSDAYRVSGFSDDGQYLYAAISGNRPSHSSVGPNRIEKLDPTTLATVDTFLFGAIDGLDQLARKVLSVAGKSASLPHPACFDAVLWIRSDLDTKLRRDEADVYCIENEGPQHSLGNAAWLSPPAAPPYPTRAMMTSLYALYFNSGDGLETEGSEDWEFLHDGSEYTIFTVFSPGSARLDDLGVVGSLQPSLSPSSYGIVVKLDGASREVTFLMADGGTAYAADLAVSLDSVSDKFIAVVRVQTASPHAELRCYRSELGLAEYQSTSGDFDHSPAGGSPGQFWIGPPSVSGIRAFMGFIPEVLVCKRALTDYEIKEVVSYLTRWWT